ncbi:unknown [Clostridium sp. CAG:413]|nr:unknown [Clostridium sp. CAG:413]
MAILPASLCRYKVRILFLCFPFGKYLFTVFTFVVLLNYRKQTPCQRFEDVFRDFGCIHAVLNIRFFCVHIVPSLSLL